MATIDAQVEANLGPFRTAVELIMSIPGIKNLSALAPARPSKVDHDERVYGVRIVQRQIRFPPPERYPAAGPRLGENEGARIGACLSSVAGGEVPHARPCSLQPMSAILTSARRLNRAAGMLAWSVLADSAIEHYRGSFKNRAMYTPILVSLMTLASSLPAASTFRPKSLCAKTCRFRSLC
jgi:hypothetical protein